MIWTENILTTFENVNPDGNIFTKKSAKILMDQILKEDVTGSITYSDGHLSLKDIVHIFNPYVVVDTDGQTLTMLVSVFVDENLLNEDEIKDIKRGFWRLVMDINYRDVNDMKEIVAINNINIEIGTEEEYNALVDKGLI